MRHPASPPRRPAPIGRAPGTGPGSAFDVCHAGVVLRAALLVQGTVAIGMLYGAGDLADWTLRFARASVASLCAMLIWLVLCCALERWLARGPAAAQWAAAIGLGAVCAVGGTLLAAGFAPPGEGARLSPWPPAASGAALAAAFFFWLRQRALARLPADTSARLAELQSRIRPHFLFNTLNTAVALVRVDPARAEAVLEDLAELFRVALASAGASARLADEVELARRYLAIEQVRFGARLRVDWQIDPQTEAARLPQLLLQPLLENAVRHGVEPAAQGGSIEVRSQRRHGEAVIDIVNTVDGAASQPGHGMALQNVRERLRLMHDVAAQFDARRDGDAFRVRIVVPIGS